MSGLAIVDPWAMRAAIMAAPGAKGLAFLRNLRASGSPMGPWHPEVLELIDAEIREAEPIAEWDEGRSRRFLVLDISACPDALPMNAQAFDFRDEAERDGQRRLRFRPSWIKCDPQGAVFYAARPDGRGGVSILDREARKDGRRK